MPCLLPLGVVEGARVFATGLGDGGPVDFGVFGGYVPRPELVTDGLVAQVSAFLSQRDALAVEVLAAEVAARHVSRHRRQDPEVFARIFDRFAAWVREERARPFGDRVEAHALERTADAQLRLDDGRLRWGSACQWGPAARHRELLGGRH